MSLPWHGQRLTLVGLASPRNKILEASKMTKQLPRQQDGILLQVFLVHLGVAQHGQQEVRAPELHQLLELFKKLFDEPSGLPPVRKQNH